MKNKRKIKKTVPAYAFGTQGSSNLPIGQMIGGAGNLLSVAPIGKSRAGSARQADMQGITDTFQGAASGAQIGAVAGPVGAIVGAVGGAIIGGIGKDGQTTQTPGFTEDNQYTYTTGLKRVFGGSSDDRRRITRDRNIVNGNRSAVRGSAQLQNDYYANNNLDAYMLEFGGQIPGSLAYVDDGEIIDTTTGMVQIPENNNPTDSNLVNLPQGSRVLSDTLKVPGTKKTFAQLGDQMMTKKRSKGNDRISENTNMLNDRNNQTIYNQLYDLQEITKERRGIRPRNKEIPEYAQGGPVQSWRSANANGGGYIRRGLESLWDTFSDRFQEGRNDVNRRGRLNLAATLRRDQLGAPGSNQPNRTSYAQPASINFSYPGVDGITMETPPTRQFYPTDTPTNTEVPVTNTHGTGRGSRTIRSTQPQTRTYNTVNPIVNDGIIPLNVPEYYTQSSIDNAPTPNISDEAIAGTAIYPRDSDGNGFNLGNIDWGQAASAIGSLAPIVSNLFSGNAEQIRPERNPYSQPIIDTMRRRRFNNRPVLDELRRNRATANYSLGQLNTNTGANLAARTATANALGSQISNVLATEQNVNNQYAAEYADTLNNLGQQDVAANRLAQDYNARSRATNRNIQRTGLSQLSTWGQALYRDSNLRNRDRAYLAAYQPLLESAYTQDTYNELLNSLRR